MLLHEDGCSYDIVEYNHLDEVAIFKKALGGDLGVRRYHDDYVIITPAIVSTRPINKTNIYLLGFFGLQCYRTVRGPKLFTKEMGLESDEVAWFKKFIGTKITQKKEKSMFYHFFFRQESSRARRIFSVERDAHPSSDNLETNNLLFRRENLKILESLKILSC